MSKFVSKAVTTRGPKDEPYPAYTKRVARDEKRVEAKCAALDQFTGMFQPTRQAE